MRNSETAITHIKHGAIGQGYMTTLTSRQFAKLWDEHCPKDYLSYSWTQHEGWAEYVINADN